MTSRKTNALRNALLSAGMLGLLATGTTAVQAQQQQQQQQPPEGWFKVCSKQQDVDVCEVRYMVIGPGGQLLTQVNLIEMTGKENNRMFQVMVPTGRMLPPGIGLQIDGGQAQKVDYLVCDPTACVAQAPLSDELINRLKRGTQLTLVSVNFQNQQNPIQVTLQGFTAVFDGPPLQQSDIEEKQRQLEEFVSRNNEDFQRRLREEQEKARQVD